MDASQVLVEIGYQVQQVSAQVSQELVEIGYETDTVNANVSQVVVEVGFVHSGRKYRVIHI